ncbi:MAG: methyltransferase [Hyphomicrobiales bacterium]
MTIRRLARHRGAGEHGVTVDDLEAERFRIYALQDGAVRAQALAFCLRTGLFDRLEESPRTFEELREALSLPARVAPALVAFLVSERLLERREDGRLANTPAASAFLVRSSPRYVGGRGLLFAGFYDAIGHLPEALATGKPWTPGGQHDMFGGFAEADQEWFADGMFANAVHGARWLMEQVDFGQFRRLLDVGGNAGGYSLTIAAAHPDLQATIADLPAVRPLAERRIREAGLEERVTFVEASFFEDSLPRGHDAILLSSILHDWAEGDCLRILANCTRALEPGGTIVVTEPMLQADYTGPHHPAASGLTMVVLGGENRTQAQICALLERSGFEGCWCSEVGLQNSVVVAHKAR